MTGPIWLSPLSHEVPWAGIPQPPAPDLWAYWFGDLGLVSTNPWPSTHHAAAREAGWVEVPRVEWRPRVESGRTA